MATAVFTEGLTKDFPIGFWRPRPHRALDRLSIEIPSGTVFGLLGPNGAGKSTTLKLLLNLIWPTAGRAEVLGQAPQVAAARQRVGFLPENPTFYDHLTAEELVTYFAGLFGQPAAEAARRAAAVLDRVGLGGERRRPLRQFSKGMLQRVGLAQALVNDAELIILDEPMSGLDPLGRRDVRDIILQLRDEGRTVLLSSHILSDAELLCSRVAILSKGRLQAAGPVDELTARARADRGWDIVVSELSPALADRMAARVRRMRRIAEGRYSLELAPHERPEPLVAELAAAGARLMSVAPLRATLEDVFLTALGADADQPDSLRPAEPLAGVAR
jgi:ABC-2 type transport system ATP-binding protein